ncbi:MAG: hypothetical protein U5L09_22945 [Bacteroidales bacterium]|nr:hypothetical protein [Bacteroidales bacterium]
MPKPLCLLLKPGFLLLPGLAALVFGGNLVITHATWLAKSFGMSEKIVGLTIVAAGTSLPELATSAVAAFKKNNDIALGNIIGSNIFNFFLVLGISALVHPITYVASFNIDLYVQLVGTILLFIMMFTGQRKKLDRWEAILLTMAFFAYMTFSVTSNY